MARGRIVAAYGPALTRLLNGVTAQLTTEDLIDFNRRANRGEQPRTVAADWLRRRGLT